MQQISLLLDKYARFGFKDQIVKETLIALVKEKYNTELHREDINLKDGNVNVRVSGPLKAEIFLNKESIRAELNARLEGNNQAHSLR